MTKNQSLICTVIVVLAGIMLLGMAIRPLFVPHLTGTADGFAHKYRLVNFHQSLSEGTLRPRWAGNAVLGYGAPLYIFNYSVPYYLVDAFYRIGFTINTAAQIYAALTIIISFLCMYALAALLWGRWAGVVAGLVYTFAPYHLFTVYSYEAWGEMLAFVFPPLLLFLLFSASRTKPSHKIAIHAWFTTTIIAWVLFILTHNISSFITSPVIVLFGLIACKNDKIKLLYLVKIILLVILISCFFTLPAFTLTDTIKIPALLTKEIALRKIYMIPVMEQIKTSWSVIMGQDIIYKEFTVGIPIVGALFAGLFSLVFSRTRKQMNPFVLSVLGILMLSLFFVDPLSDVFYAFRPLQYVLYPYRFLFLATFAGSLIAGCLLRKHLLVGIFFVIVTVMAGYPFAHPYMDIFLFPRSFFSQPQMLGFAVPTLKTMGIAEFLPATADINFLVNEEQRYLTQGTLPEKFILPPDSGSVVRSSVKQESLSATIQAGRNLRLTVSTLYYPNWTASIDGKHVPISHDTFGRITLDVPAGTHDIRLRFGYSTIEKLGWSISAAGIVLFLLFLTYPRIIHEAIVKCIRPK
ncbi:hypothetical protein KKB64_04655 [Patescibacteria group bacterium]|nr:hypothetical protein [Patescibacteria group bacterium]MBU1473041.1 hypothetical protein [Patescibacteria group bacterium]MBU2460203.1 hypothetical protein [Patescibacteria group bacterium]MBU2543910.1 hypothetical protein [Patescibacteria group bacterium]